MEELTENLREASHNLNHNFFVLFESRATGERSFAGDDHFLKRFVGETGLKRRREDAPIGPRCVQPLAPVYEAQLSSSLRSNDAPRKSPNPSLDPSPDPPPGRSFDPSSDRSTVPKRKHSSTKTEKRARFSVESSTTSTSNESPTKERSTTGYTKSTRISSPLDPDDADYWLSESSVRRRTAVSCRPVMVGHNSNASKRRPTTASSFHDDKYDGWLADSTLSYLAELDRPVVRREVPSLSSSSSSPGNDDNDNNNDDDDDEHRGSLSTSSGYETKLFPESLPSIDRFSRPLFNSECGESFSASR